jgi:hypothetical protein
MTAVRDEAVDAVKSLVPTDDEKASLSVLSDVAQDLKILARQELELAKAEMSAEASKVGKGAGMFGGAAFAAVMFVIFLSTAAWWGLANVMDQSWASLIVAGVWALIAGVLAIVGRATLRSISLKPERTINSFKRIPDALKGR